MTRNCHVRFWNGGGGGDASAYRNSFVLPQFIYLSPTARLSDSSAARQYQHPITQWRRVVNTERSRFRPGPSFGEYHAQMDALLALISAHTSLLLYDVR